MPVYYPIGGVLVTYDEMVERVATGDLQRFVEATKQRQKESIAFEMGTAESVPTSGAPESPGDTVPWKEIGPNKPLTIEIYRVYTGDHRQRDLLVTSAIKSAMTFDASPRAVNLLTNKVDSNKDIEAVPATDKGTFIVYHNPAVMDRQLNFQVDMSFDNFDTRLFDTVGSLFQAAAGIPIFAPQQGILMAAGLITKLVSSIANSIVDRSPKFEEQDVIRINRPGHPIPEPGFRLLVPDAFTPDMLSEFKYSSGQLVDESGTPYGGPHPYIVLSLDGTPNDALREFAPTAASAALLERFMKVKEGSEVATDHLLSALKLASDIKFRREAEAVRRKLGEIDPGSPDYEGLKGQFDALVASIVSEDLRLSL